MPTLAERLYRIESRLRSLIEGSSARLFADPQLRQNLSIQLVAAMQTGARPLPNGETAAPNLYMVSVNPFQFKTLQEDSRLLDELAETLQDAGINEGLRFFSPPVIRVVEDTQAVPHQMHITTRISIEQLDDTTDITVDPQPGESISRLEAFLVVDGTRLVPLDHAVINVGRRQDNDVVIEDRRVSRVHAQLRAVNGHYMIFDLDSSAGTYVNDQRIHQSLLYPGDVISLGGVPLVYGQEPGTMGQTQKLFPPETGT